MEDLKVISLGGSLIVPDGVDTEFLSQFYTLLKKYLAADPTRRLILVCGGGSLARNYQQAFQQIHGQTGSTEPQPERQDWLGIMASRLNGELVKHVFADYCENDVVYNPTSAFTFTGRLLVAAGWKPGFSTDFDAVMLAKRFQAESVINLSNIPKVYTDDPKLNPQAQPIDAISWADFQQLVGEEWVPGKNAPFDPVASKQAAAGRLKVIMAGGKDLANLARILNDEPFVGTEIGPD